MARTTSHGAGDVAIIGLALRLPGADDLSTLWSNLRSGVESIRRFSPEELEGLAPGTASQEGFVPAGSTLLHHDRFDAAFFGYSAREAEAIDPQQRLFLECSWHAMEDAGYAPTQYSGLVGVIAGSGINTYLINNVHPNRGYTPDRTFLETTSDLQLMIANQGDFLATRVSYKLNLQGPSLNVQTGCSTALVAIHLGCQTLLSGECDLVLAGASTVRVPHASGYMYEPGMVASPDGHCRPFDRDAQGTVFGSGVGVFVLKLAEQALSDGDPIYAVIRGSGASNDGSERAGFSAPSVAGQMRAIAEAIDAAALEDLDQIDYVEGHGTATVLGDAVELAALRKVFGGRQMPLVVGSIKGNLGHLSWSSGVAGLAKVILAMREGAIPPTLHFQAASPEVELGVLRINAELVPWPSDRRERLAGVSAFGLGGTNAHLIVASPPEPYEPSDFGVGERVALPLSAKTPSALEELKRSYRDFLRSTADVRVGDLAFTAATGRVHFEHRFACSGTSAQELARSLDAASEPAQSAGARKLAFLFTGQGCQYVGMGRELYDKEPIFRAELERCDAILAPLIGSSLEEVLYPADKCAEALNSLYNTQAVLFAFEWALAGLWQSWGLVPDLVFGHSTGEYVAACLAGVMSLSDGLMLSVERGRLFAQRLSDACMMVTVLAGEEETLDALAGLQNDAGVASINGPLSTVVSGSESAMKEFCRRLDGRGIKNRPLSVARAAHSPLTEPILEDLGNLFEKTELSLPNIVLVSSKTGRAAGAEITGRDYWESHTRDPVRFLDALQSMLDLGARQFVEIGPDPVLLGMAAFCPNVETADFLPSLRRRAFSRKLGDRDVMRDSLERLYVRGYDVDWNAYYKDSGFRRVHLPTYPFAKDRHWIESRKLPAVLNRAREGRPLDDVEGLLQVHWVEQARARDHLDVGRWLLVGDESTEATRLAEALVRRGHSCDVLGDAELVDSGAMGERLRGVDHLVVLCGVCPGLGDREAADERIWRHVRLAIASVRACGSLVPSPRVWWLAAGPDADGTQDPREGLPQPPVFALARVAAMEHPGLRISCIDHVGPGAEEGLAEELASGGGENEIVLRSGRRWVARLREGPSDVPQARPTLSPEGSYWVTGGLGGLGRLVISWLVARGARHVVAISRSAPTAEARASIAALGGDATVVVARADVCVPAAVRALFARSPRPVLGIVHAAGVLEDGLLADLRRDRFMRVAAPKARGAQVLHELSLEFAPRLEHFILFSSAASLVGNPGQASHAVANAALDSLAQQRRALGLPAVSINWGAWTERGRLAGDGDLTRRLRREGFRPITDSLGMAALDAIVACDTAQVGCIPMDWERRVALYSLEQTPLFGELHELGGGTPAPPDLPSEIAANPPHQRAARLAGVIREEACELLGLCPDDPRFRADISLVDLGMDSLSAIQLRNRLQRRLGQPLDPTFVFDYSTLDGMTARLATLPWERRDVPPASPVRKAPAPARIPLSSQQRRWLSLVAGGYGQRVVPIVFELPLNREAFRAALRDVILEHELLRYRYPRGEIQVLDPDAVMPSPAELFIDVPAEDDPCYAQALRAMVQERYRSMPDPSESPSWRIAVLAPAPEAQKRFVVLLSLQHLEFDGSSLTTFTEELSKVYRARAEGRAPDPCRSIARYAEYALWQEAYCRSQIQVDQAYFQGLYASTEGPTLLPDHPGMARTTARTSLRYSPPQVEGLWKTVQQTAGQLSVTPFSMLCGQYALLLSELTGSSPVVIAMIVSGRPDERFSRTIGPFTAPFPVPVRVSGDARDAARQVQRSVAGISARAHYPVADLTQHVSAFSGLPPDTYFSDAGINFANYRHPDEHDTAARVVEILGEVDDPAVAPLATNSLPRIPGLHLVITHVGDDLRFNFWYHRDRIDLKTVRGWAERYLELVRRPR